MSVPLSPLAATVPGASGRLSAGVPPPESHSRQVAIRTVAVVAVLVSLVYLVWRVAATMDMSVWWLSVPLLMLEVHALVSLLLFMAPLWDLDAVPPPRPVDRTKLRLAVVIPTYNEPVEILLPTVAAAVSVRLPHETWVLDDGNRPEVAALASSLGARYLARPTNEHAKAGNVNFALDVIDTDVIALLDADHVADRNLLRHTLGYFDDPAVALVQTPQDFYNVDSFEHQPRPSRRWWRRHEPTGAVAERFSEQELFYRGLQPGRNRFDAAFCCGTGAVLRTSALLAVGGLATDTITEDIHTTIRLHRAGWRTRYHNEVLARGLAAADAGQYLVQRVRWGTGAMQVLRCENPAFVSGLTPMQRVSYLGTLLGWFECWRTLGYLLVPMAAILTGAVPVRVDALTFVLAFGTVFTLQRLALAALSRGMAPQGIATVFELVRLPATLLATTRLVTSGTRAFTVTAKGRVDDRRARTRVPRLLLALLVATIGCSGWFAASVQGWTPTEYAVPWAAHASFGWLAVNGVLLTAAVRRIRQQRFAAERRAAVRFDVAGTVEVDGARGCLLDASLTGVLVELPSRSAAGVVVGEAVCVTLDLGERTQRFEAVVRSARPTPSTGLPGQAPSSPGSWVVGLELADGQDRARAALALALFATDAEMHLVEEVPHRAYEPVAA